MAKKTDNNDDRIENLDQGIDKNELFKILKSITDQQNKLVEDQVKFKEEVQLYVNKNADQIREFMQMSKNNIQTPQIATGDEIGSNFDEVGGYIDSDGVSWGKTLPPHMKKQAKPTNGNPLANLDINAILPQLLEIGKMLLMKPQQNNVMAELGMRAFMEKYQKGNIMDKAFNNFLFQKGLMSEEDHNIINENSSILDDPVTQFTRTLKDKPVGS